MGIITNIKSGIEARIEATVADYAKLSYQNDIEDNKFKGNSKGYSVNVGSSSEVDGVIGSFNLDQEYIINLTNSYNDGAKSQIGDSLKSQRVTELNDDILSIYSDLLINKSSVDSSILLISELAISEPEFIEESKIIIVSFNIVVKHKTNL